MPCSYKFCKMFVGQFRYWSDSPTYDWLIFSVIRKRVEIG